MRGGAQSHMMRGANGDFYVVKFQNNPQGSRVLANDYIASRIAERLGLPVPAPEIVEVGEWLVRKTSELHMQLGGEKTPCVAGLQFGSRFISPPMEGQIFDYMPESFLNPEHIRNFEIFPGALAFDKWTCNGDGRQMLYWRRGRERKYTAALVDQGYCFNANEWNFPDSPLRGVFSLNLVYEQVQDWRSFEPWLSRIENFDAAELASFAEAVPPEWYAGDWDALQGVLAKLLTRRARVRELINEFRVSSRKPFPNWKGGAAQPAPKKQFVM